MEIIRRTTNDDVVKLYFNTGIGDDERKLNYNILRDTLYAHIVAWNLPKTCPEWKYLSKQYASVLIKSEIS